MERTRKQMRSSALALAQLRRRKQANESPKQEEQRAYELEILGKRTLDIRREEDLDLARQIVLPGSNQNFVVDEFNRAYIAYADRAVALARKRALEQTGRFRVQMSSCPLPEWMKS